ncbi:hypothetical protein M9H77_30900 [Catharanthus roseus]|uniref:Uncharacterized protein n=1 Tax=Catharanthus roseus TaxID=4058 RepID=A0ACB9ZYJ0_CATRO|nr:hypothetical protein M9H77_30900 [Catharanthus roseus]
MSSHFPHCVECSVCFLLVGYASSEEMGAIGSEERIFLVLRMHVRIEREKRAALSSALADYYTCFICSSSSYEIVVPTFHFVELVLSLDYFSFDSAAYTASSDGDADNDLSSFAIDQTLELTNHSFQNRQGDRIKDGTTRFSSFQAGSTSCLESSIIAISLFSAMPFRIENLYLQAPLLYSRASFAPLLGRASFDAPAPNKLLVGIVELSLKKGGRYGYLRAGIGENSHPSRNRTFDRTALFYAPFYPERKMNFAPLGARRSRGSREGKRTHPLLHLTRDNKERAPSIDEQRINGALGIALFFSHFLSASSDHFLRNFFVRTEPLAESNPIPQDLISAIHPPCIYAGDIASAMGFGLCREKKMNEIVALHSPPMRKDVAEKNGTLFRSIGCLGSRITSELFTLQFKHVGAKCYPALLLRSNRSLLMLLRRCFFAFSLLGTRVLVETGREQAKRVVHNGKKDTTTSPISWTTGANIVIFYYNQEPFRIFILTYRWFLTVGFFISRFDVMNLLFSKSLVTSKTTTEK